MENKNQTPRVNGELLQRFVGKRVRIVGRVEIADSNTVSLVTSDEQRVALRALPRDGGDRVQACVEITAEVLDSRTLQEISYRVFNETFDAKAYNEMVHLANGQYSELFVA